MVRQAMVWGPLRYYHSPSGLGDLVPNQNGLWVILFHRPYNVQTNSVGFRNTEEPSASAFQILAVGDSRLLALILPMKTLGRLV